MRASQCEKPLWQWLLVASGLSMGGVLFFGVAGVLYSICERRYRQQSAFVRCWEGTAAVALRVIWIVMAIACLIFGSVWLYAIGSFLFASRPLDECPFSLM